MQTKTLYEARQVHSQFQGSNTATCTHAMTLSFVGHGMNLGVERCMRLMRRPQIGHLSGDVACALMDGAALAVSIARLCLGRVRNRNLCWLCKIGFYSFTYQTASVLCGLCANLSNLHTPYLGHINIDLLKCWVAENAVMSMLWFWKHGADWWDLIRQGIGSWNSIYSSY